MELASLPAMPLRTEVSDLPRVSLAFTSIGWKPSSLGGGFEFIISGYLIQMISNDDTHY